jgi:hypothetical protein
LLEFNDVVQIIVVFLDFSESQEVADGASILVFWVDLGMTPDSNINNYLWLVTDKFHALVNSWDHVSVPHRDTVNKNSVLNELVGEIKGMVAEEITLIVISPVENLL